MVRVSSARIYKARIHTDTNPFRTHDHTSIPTSCRLAVGSYMEEYTNRIQVLGLQKDEEGYVKANINAVIGSLMSMS